MSGPRLFDSSTPALAHTQPGPVSTMRWPRSILMMRLVSRRITSTMRGSLSVVCAAICCANGDAVISLSRAMRPSAFDTTF